MPQGATDFSGFMGLSEDVTHEGLLHLKNDVAPKSPGTWKFHLARVEETFIRTASDNTGNESARDNAMYDDNNDIGRGFAERTKALSMTIFTNSQDGAALYVHGNQPAGPKGILRLEDTYISVATEMTYLMNTVKKEGADIGAGSIDVQENKVNPHASSVKRVVYDPYEDKRDDPLIDRLTIEVEEEINIIKNKSTNDSGVLYAFADKVWNIFSWLLAGGPSEAYAATSRGQLISSYSVTETWDSYYVDLNPSSAFHHEGREPHLGRMDYNIEEYSSSPGSTEKAWACWLRLHNQSQSILEVKMATAAPRLVVFNLGIANLARYTEGNYNNTITFTLMPIVG